MAVSYSYSSLCRAYASGLPLGVLSAAEVSETFWVWQQRGWRYDVWVEVDLQREKTTSPVF